jgi:putative ABC transport system permease protein
MSIIGYVDSVGRDLRHALRALPRRPSFTFAAVVTLALGLGATTAIFSVVYSVLLKPLPYPNSGELVRIRHTATVATDDLGSSTTQYLTYRAENKTLEEIGMWGDGGETLTRADGTDRVRSLRVTHGLLQALGVQPCAAAGSTKPSIRPRPKARPRSFSRTRSRRAASAATRRLSGAKSRSTGGRRKSSASCRATSAF